MNMLELSSNDDSNVDSTCTGHDNLIKLDQAEAVLVRVTVIGDTDTTSTVAITVVNNPVTFESFFMNDENI